MGHMAVMRLGLVVILEPFLELAVPADLMWGKPGASRIKPDRKFFVATQPSRSSARISEQLTIDLHVDGRRHASMRGPAIRQTKGVFRRVRRRGYQPVVLRF